MKPLSFVLCFLTAACLSLVADEPPTSLDLGEEAFESAEEAIIPIPLEIFASLDKLGNQDWDGQIRPRLVKTDANRSRTALLFGLVVSEGFIAVQAKDRNSVSRIGRDVLKLAGPLAVASDVEGHANAIIEGAENKDWSMVRRELDKTRLTVVNRMREQHDGELVALVSLGGWLGGTEALASVLEMNYSSEGSDLLNQPLLVKQLKEAFAKLPARDRRGELFVQVEKTLDDLELLMKGDDAGTVSEGNVAEISNATKTLVTAIYES